MPDNQPRKSPLRFLGFGLQIAAIVALMAFAGHWLDGKMDTSKPWFTLGLSLLGIILAMVYMVREIPRL